MPKRTDNIHKRKDGRWEGRYKKGRYPDGTIIYGSVYGKSYKEAKEKLALVPKADDSVLIKKRTEKTFADVFELWMENNRIRLKGATLNKYQNIIDTHIIPELGNYKLTQINATLINSFLTKKQESGRINGSKPLAPSYVRSIVLVINAAINFAVKEGLCQPLKTPINKPSEPKPDFVVLDFNEQKQLEQYLCTEITFETVGILISLHTGLRFGEVCALRWEDVDFINCIIKVRHTVARVKNYDETVSQKSKLIIDTPKTKSSKRDIPISSVLFPILCGLYDKATSEFVLSDNASFMKPRTYEYRFHRLLNEVGIASVNFHALRHTFATRCIEAGVDVKSLSEILGHANVSITLNTYVHSSMDMKRNQIEKLVSLTA